MTSITPASILQNSVAGACLGMTALSGQLTNFLREMWGLPQITTPGQLYLSCAHEMHQVLPKCMQALCRPRFAFHLKQTGCSFKSSLAPLYGRLRRMAGTPGFCACRTCSRVSQIRRDCATLHWRAGRYSLLRLGFVTSCAYFFVQVGNGVCNIQCNNAGCGWDGGDCGGYTPGEGRTVVRSRKG
jgi:hypothetical protein